MTDERNDLILRHLRDIRSKQDEQNVVLADHSARFLRLEKQLGDMTKVVRYALGQASETQLRQAEQEKRIDELFDKVETLLSAQPS